MLQSKWCGSVAGKLRPTSMLLCSRTALVFSAILQLTWPAEAASEKPAVHTVATVLHVCGEITPLTQKTVVLLHINVVCSCSLIA